MSLSGVFLLEINCFNTDGPIDTFLTKTRTDDNSPGVLFFDGFQTRRAGQAEDRPGDASASSRASAC